MEYQINYGCFRSAFAVPVSVVDEHIRLCGALQLKVLLILLRHNEPMEASAIASCLNLPAAEIQDALSYWIVHGLVQEGGEHTFVDEQKTSNSASQPVSSPVKNTEPIHEKELAKGENRVVLVSSKPRLSRQEALDLIAQDGKLAQLMQEIQQALGKPLSSADMDTVVALYSYYGLAADFILMVVYYCHSIGKNNMRYIEKTAAGWVNDGIDTYDKAERHIKFLTEKNCHENQVRSAFGIGDRKLGPKEQKYINSWFNEYHFDIAMIRLAYERTVDNIGKLSFPYIDTILKSWHEKGYRTPKEAIEEAPPVQAPSPTSSSYNISDLERQIFDNFITQK